MIKAWAFFHSGRSLKLYFPPQAIHGNIFLPRSPFPPCFPWVLVPVVTTATDPELDSPTSSTVPTLDYIPRTFLSPTCLLFVLKLFCPYFLNPFPLNFCAFCLILSHFPFACHTSAFSTIDIAHPRSPSTWNPICSQILGSSPCIQSENASSWMLVGTLYIKVWNG